MKDNTQLIVMLTHNDYTVANAREIFEECKNSHAQYFGVKETGIPKEDLKQLFSYMKSCGKTTALEVVAYTQEDCLQGAQLALECGCDILMGTLFYPSVNAFCLKNNIKYMPFVGTVEERPSVLKGDIDAMIAQAKDCIAQGVYGIDLLGYRYVGDAFALMKRLTDEVDAPVCVAGSINSYEKLKQIRQVAPWGFTVGGAFFEHRFGNGFEEQINNVCDSINKSEIYAEKPLPL